MVKKILIEPPPSTKSIKVPDKLLEQVIGQDKAVEIVRKAATQQRHVLLIGEPGTGKSMIAQGMAELLPKGELQDIVVSENKDDPNNPLVDSYPRGKGKAIVDQWKNEVHKIEKFINFAFFFLFFSVMLIVAYYFLILRTPLILFGGIVAAVFLLMGRQYIKAGKMINQAPKLLVSANSKTPFVDATGAHAGSLLGDVRHDPFQSGGLETPAHNRVEPGAIHRAHKGVLFIDEIATLKPKLQIELLTAMQEKKYQITGQSERSSGAMVRTTPVPCDFILVAAGNFQVIKDLHPALRSRIRGSGYEVYMNETMPDTPENQEKLVRFIAQEVKKDGKIPHFDDSAIKEIILEAKKMSQRKGHLTLRLRELGGLVRAAGDVARTSKSAVVSRDNVVAARKLSRTLEQQFADKLIERKKEYQVIKTEGSQVGRVNGLALIGDSGIVLPIEAEVTPGGEKSEIIATGKLGEIAKEAIHNVNAIVRKLYGEDIKETKDVYVQFLQTYEGVEGDSASIAVATAIISALKKVPVKQNVAMTGSLSIRGEVLPIGGVTHKIEAAIEAGMKKVLVPQENIKDIFLNRDKKNEIEIVSVSRIEDVLKHSLEAKSSFWKDLGTLAKIVSGKPAGA
jgi:Lon-like ATP-dependent protease